ncbi:MAG: TetR/AcrR family transcriptional regulator [Acidimicrobiales bacterium]|jgi:AcrR family transcriptional regulator
MTGARRSELAPSRPTRNVGRAQRRGDRTRDAIVEETIRCINEEGFAAASASHIAERAGVTWGVIQYHFGDRNGLLSAVIAHGFQCFRTAIASVSVPDGTSRQRVEAVVGAAWTAFSSAESRASLEILISARASRDQARIGELEHMARDMRELSSVLIGSGNDSGHHGAVVGEVLWATLRGLVMAQMLSSRPIDSSGERALLVDLITGLLDRDAA